LRYQDNSNLIHPACVGYAIYHINSITALLLSSG
jgi:hypothetical protein